MDDPYVDEKLYPSVVQELAGMSMTGVGISLVLNRAIVEYADGMPHLLVVAYTQFEDWITALVDDEPVRNEALTAARQAGIID